MESIHSPFLSRGGDANTNTSEQEQRKNKTWSTPSPQETFEEQLRPFDPTYYIGITLVIILVFIAVAVAAQRRFRRRKDKHLEDDHHYVPATLDGLSDEQIKEVQQMRNPEKYGYPKRSHRDIMNYSLSDYHTEYNRDKDPEPTG